MIWNMTIFLHNFDCEAPGFMCQEFTNSNWVEVWSFIFVMDRVINQKVNQTNTKKSINTPWFKARSDFNKRVFLSSTMFSQFFLLYNRLGIIHLSHCLLASFLLHFKLHGLLPKQLVYFLFLSKTAKKTLNNDTFGMLPL